MQCIRAKTNHLIRRQAIKHYLHDKRRDVFTFMSLWNDEEPYPLSELIIAQLFYIDELKADAKNLKEPEHIQSLIRSEEVTLQKIAGVTETTGRMMSKKKKPRPARE
ncbi:Uncharacterised protein [Haemophilus parahaemolyticus]|uniref:Uncharacterized protein n=1 Tax=Haemophilus parahaemolyticus TaxID=735 RepID=A0A377I3Q0_HAEPH|nr:hypothetical protein [Haemophilus parahaemolyticus]STO65166.1 Uncharacterised protein [Haemophilus parahaemolyticus]